MTIHRARLFYSTTGAASFHQWLSTWLTNMTPWEADEVGNEAPSETSAAGVDGGTEHYRVELAFEWSHDKAIIIQQLDQYLAAYCDWHRLGYHVCTHDGDTEAVVETLTLSSGEQTPLDRAPVDGSITIGSGGYAKGKDYETAASSLSIPADTSIANGEYTVEYETKQCQWDEVRESGSIPADIPTLQ